MSYLEIIYILTSAVNAVHTRLESSIKIVSSVQKQFVYNCTDYKLDDRDPGQI